MYMRRILVISFLLLLLFVSVNIFERKNKSVVVLHHYAPVIRVGNISLNFFELEVKYFKLLGYRFYKISDYNTINLKSGKNMFLTFDDG